MARSVKLKCSRSIARKSDAQVYFPWIRLNICKSLKSCPVSYGKHSDGVKVAKELDFESFFGCEFDLINLIL